MMRWQSMPVLAACAVLIATTSVSGQQTTMTPAATQPGKDVFIHRSLVQWSSWDGDPARDGFSGATEFRTDLSFAWGVSGDWSLAATIPVIHRDFDGSTGTASDDPTGIGDPRIEFKHRFVNEPLGPVDTMRVAWFVGAELPVGTDALSSHSIDPYIGLSMTRITGRLGLGAAITYKATTGSADRPLAPGSTTADLLKLNGSVAWRLHPEQWGQQRDAAWYLTLESELSYETSGEWSVAFAPGVLLEAPDYALELAVVIPLHDETKRRPELEYSVIAGVRVFF